MGWFWVEPRSRHSNAFTSASVTPDGLGAVSESEDRTMRVWELEKGACLVLACLSAEVRIAAFLIKRVRLSDSKHRTRIAAKSSFRPALSPRQSSSLHSPGPSEQPARQRCQPSMNAYAPKPGLPASPLPRWRSDASPLSFPQ